MLYSTYSQILD